MIDIRLLGAQKAMGYLTFYGDDNVEVPEGFLAETTAGVRYVTLSSGVITGGSVTLPASAAVAREENGTDFESNGYGTNDNGTNSDGTKSYGKDSYGKYSNGSNSNGTKSNGANTDGSEIDTGNADGSHTN